MSTELTHGYDRPKVLPLGAAVEDLELSTLSLHELILTPYEDKEDYSPP